VFDVFDLSRVLIRSITRLCRADHQDDPQALGLWTANKDPATIRGWITSGVDIWLAERAGQTTAVGGMLATGKITLLYVDPDHVGCGVGSALLHRLEDELVAKGCVDARLEATRTALSFYTAHGWSPDGPEQSWNGIPQFPMRKSLHPND